MTDPIRIPAHPAIGIHGWEMTITPDIQAQILAPAMERIAALERDAHSHNYKGVAVPTVADPFLGPAHQSELERAHLLSVADQCEQDGDAHGAADAYDAADKPAMVRVPPPTLMVGNGGTNTDTKPAAQGDEAADTDTEARATIRGIIFKRFTVTTTDEMRVQISYDIFAAIRRGDVPGVYDESAVKQEQAASYAAGVRDGQAIGVAEIARLREKLDGSVNTKTHEHAVRYAEQMVADRDRLAAQVAELTRELETAKDGRAVHLKSHNEAAAERDRALAELAALRAENAESFAANARIESQLQQVESELAAEREKCATIMADFAGKVDDYCRATAELAQWKERAEKAEESQRHTQKAREDDRGRLQQKCSDWGTYWRAPDAHGVELSIEQAVELLQDALGVEVEIKDAARAEAEAAKQEAARMRARKVLPCLPQVGDYAPWGQVKDIVRRELKAAGVEVES